ncbi:hypothetical protein V1477_000323 [Vespula maculifrons]|uniref:Uncharacterized protein n=3 Tax=Vespula TaxID=7451 RepID=A0A834JDH8_VESGE|nr:hypothetical protein HZH66_012084 [Vespula vulgaris]KAF7386198.1 hypothetical protein HZH68_013330 [Vespula germanica]
MAGRAFIIRGIFTASTLGQPIAPAMSSFPIVSARDDVSVKDGGRSTSPSKLRIYGSVATSVFTRRDALLLQQESEVSITGIAATGKPWCTLGSSSLVQFIGI